MGNLYPYRLYRYYPAIRQGFSGSRTTSNNNISPVKFCYIQVLSFLYNPKDLDLSYKTDLDFWDCLGKKETLCYI